MFVPVSITVGAGGQTRAGYTRSIQTAARFDRLAEQVRDMTEPFTAVGGDLRTQIEMAFATEGSSGASGKWQPLSENYAAWKAQKGGGSLPLLVGLRPTGPVHHRPQKRNMSQTYAKSGQTMRSLLQPLQDSLTWHISPRRLAYTPGSDIAGYLESGTEHMPARPPVDPTVTFLHSIDRTFTAWIAKLAREAGL